ncbi:MAG: hypothetical protein AAFX39_17505, partial [Pseudomonadota bacterium]
MHDALARIVQRLGITRSKGLAQKLDTTAMGGGKPGPQNLVICPFLPINRLMAGESHTAEAAAKAADIVADLRYQAIDWKKWT